MVNIPFISPASVRIALDSLLYSSSDKEVQLLYLSLVDEFLTDPDLPPSSHNREFALSHILTLVIQNEFAHQRAILGVRIPESDQSKEVVFDLIRQDGQSISAELIGWSWLYHHYVRVDLDIQVQIFCRLLHIEERTLRRYQQYILKRLTSLLITDEWSARKRQHDRRLLAELPRSANFEFLPVRDNLTAYVNNMFDEAKPAHFYISGSRGIGKTTFVERILHHQINEDNIDQLIWIPIPVSVTYIHNYLLERLIYPESKLELREYLLLHRTVIVLDDSELLFNDLTHLHALLQMLTPAVVFMTASGTYATLPDTIQIDLQEFSEHDAKSYISRIVDSVKYSLSINDDLMANIWDHVGGNPLSLQMVVRNLPYFDLKSINSLLGLNALYERIFYGLGEEAQRVWIIMALSPPSQMEFNLLRQIWAEYITRDSIGTLLQYHIVESSDSIQYCLTNGARHYIEDAHKNGNEYLRKLSSYLIGAFDNGLSSDVEHKEAYLVQLEYLLIVGWGDIDPYLNRKWVLNWHSEGVRHKHWAAWRTILQKQINSDSIDLRLHRSYALCLQHLGEWQLSEQLIDVMLLEAGRIGAFTEQAEILLQLSVILRYQGKYEKALEVLSRVEKIAFRHDISALIIALSVERINLAIDLGNVQLAQPYLSNLIDDVQTYFLKSEIYFLEGNNQQSRAYAQLALPSAKNDFVFRARIYTLLGRICEQENNLEGAEEDFSWSLMILEQNEDLFAMSRAQLNLGALFISTGNHEEALVLLQEAEKIQLHLRDQVTLAAIRHNMRLLDIALSN
jgi:tetratricopeptide (TPR) repeat protein